MSLSENKAQTRLIRRLKGRIDGKEETRPTLLELQTRRELRTAYLPVGSLRQTDRRVESREIRVQRQNGKRRKGRKDILHNGMPAVYPRQNRREERLHALAEW